MHCRKKWILSTLSILFAGVVLTGCGKTIKQKNDSLHIYASGSDVIMDYAVKEFQRRYPDMRDAKLQKMQRNFMGIINSSQRS